MCRTNLKNYIYNNMYLFFLNFPRKQAERGTKLVLCVDMYLLLGMREERSFVFIDMCSLLKGLRIKGRSRLIC